MSVLHVIFRVGDAEYAIAASDVVQMESFSGATHVPGSASYVAGTIPGRGPRGRLGGCMRAVRPGRGLGDRAGPCRGQLAR